MKTYKITHELAQGVLNYLITRPYCEVSAFIAGFERLESIDQPFAPPIPIQAQKENKAAEAAK